VAVLAPAEPPVRLDRLVMMPAVEEPHLAKVVERDRDLYAHGLALRPENQIEILAGDPIRRDPRKAAGCRHVFGDKFLVGPLPRAALLHAALYAVQ